MAQSSQERYKTLGKGEFARMSNFSFPHTVFKRLILQTLKNNGLFGKGLINALKLFLDGNVIFKAPCSV